MKTKFPYEHVINYETKEVWISCNSVTTALGIPELIKKYYPGYIGRIGSKEYLDTLRNQLAN